MDTLEQECGLVQDVLCRNVTETRSVSVVWSRQETGNILIKYCCRFDEKCWVEEESSCRTVYDTVWENKCEMVSANKL